jgi:phosphoenolpyruvate carboxylase
VPLFETIADLRNCGRVMNDLLTLPHYARLSGAAAAAGSVLGYSDARKDGSFLTSGWGSTRRRWR